MNTTNYTVIGAGHGGKAMAAHLALMGFRVTLYNRTPERVAAIKARRGIDLESYDGGPARLCAAGGHHIRYGRGVGRRRHDHGRRAIFGARRYCPGRRAPPARWADRRPPSRPHAGRDRIQQGSCSIWGCRADFTIAEAETFIYASRSDGPAQARIFRIKEAVPLAALPAKRTAAGVGSAGAGLSAVH